jgi:hypothetical protein
VHQFKCQTDLQMCLLQLLFQPFKLPGAAQLVPWTMLVCRMAPAVKHLSSAPELAYVAVRPRSIRCNRQDNAVCSSFIGTRMQIENLYQWHCKHFRYQRDW